MVTAVNVFENIEEFVYVQRNSVNQLVLNQFFFLIKGLQGRHDVGRRVRQGFNRRWMDDGVTSMAVGCIYCILSEIS